MKKLFFRSLLLVWAGAMAIGCSEMADVETNSAGTRAVDNPSYGTYSDPVQAGTHSDSFFFTESVRMADNSVTYAVPYYTVFTLEEDMQAVLHTYSYDYTQLAYMWLYREGSMITVRDTEVSGSLGEVVLDSYLPITDGKTHIVTTLSAGRYRMTTKGKKFPMQAVRTGLSLPPSPAVRCGM